MHVFLMPHNLHQVGMRPWMEHILNIVFLTFILTSQSSFLDSIRNILSSSLQNLSLSTISDNCVLFALVYHFADFTNEFYTASEKINFSYYILLHLITSYSSYFEGKKGIIGNKTSFFLLMQLRHCASRDRSRSVYLHSSSCLLH